MSNQRSIRLSLAGAIALAMYGVASIATAQPAGQQATQQVPPPPPPPPPATPAQPPAPPTPAQPPAPPQPPPPATSQNETGQSGSGQFYQGTESSAQYQLPDSNGGTLTVNAGMPAQGQNYGPPPSFKSLDTNHNGCVSESEARAYPPLDSDFLFASNQGKCISRKQYERWVNTQGGSP